MPILSKPSPGLPIELILDLMDLLAAVGGPANRRSAAYLAQLNGWLRASTWGKRARYSHALVSHSLSMPNVLPANMEHETEVLVASRWPHQAPRTLPKTPIEETGPNVHHASGGCVVSDGFLLRAKNHKGIVHLKSDPNNFISHTATAGQPSAFANAATLPTVYPFGSLQWSCPMKFASDAHSDNFVVIYTDFYADGSVTENVIEVWNTSTKSLALPDEQARLRLPCSGPERIEHGDISQVEIQGDYILLRHSGDLIQVRRWRPARYSPEAHFTVAWELKGPEAESYLQVTLLPDHLVALQTFPSPPEPGEPPHTESRLELYRLNQDTSRHVATFLIPAAPKPFAAGSNYVLPGARIAPNEEGIIVIMTMGVVRMMRVSQLVAIVCPSVEPAQSDKALVFDTEWCEKHMMRFEHPESDYREVNVAVSGCRCVFLLRRKKHPGEAQTGVMQFVDFSNTCCNLSAPGLSAPPLVYEHALSEYLPPTCYAVNDPHREVIVSLKGARLLVYAHPLYVENAQPPYCRPSLFTWHV